MATIENGCEAIGGGCFWAEFWKSYEPMANFLAHDGFRNGALVVAAIVTLVIAIWRAQIADEDKKTSIKQADTSEAGLNIDRFQKGAAMLGDERLSVRQAGLLMLSELAQQNMHEYFDSTQKVICSFIRDRSKEQIAKFESNKQNRMDVEKRQKTLEQQANRDYIYPKLASYAVNSSDLTRSARSYFDEPITQDNQTAIEELGKLNGLFWSDDHFDNIRAEIKISIQGANFRRAVLIDMDLRSIDFSDVNLEHAKLRLTNFAGSNFRGANLCWANVLNANFERADFLFSEFSNPDKNLFILTDWTSQQLIKSANVDPEFLAKLKAKEYKVTAEAAKASGKNTST